MWATDHALRGGEVHVAGDGAKYRRPCMLLHTLAVIDDTVHSPISEGLSPISVPTPAAVPDRHR